MTENENLRHYEFAFLVNPEFTESGARAELTKIEERVKKDGSVVSQYGMRRVTLAYPIKKKSQAMLESIVAKAPADFAANLLKDLKLNACFLRVMVTSFDPRALEARAPRLERRPMRPAIRKIAHAEPGALKKAVEVKPEDIDRAVEKLMEKEL